MIITKVYDAKVSVETLKNKRRPERKLQSWIVVFSRTRLHLHLQLNL